jgi:hypothetical protein
MTRQDNAHNTNRHKKSVAARVRRNAEDDSKRAATAFARAEAWARSPAGTPYETVLNTLQAAAEKGEEKKRCK